MTAWHDAPALRTFLDRVARRLAWLEGVRGATRGFTIAAGIGVIGWLSRTPFPWIVASGVLITAIVAVAATPRLRRRASFVTAEVERVLPGSRNVIRTAAELIERPDRIHPSIGERICRDAVRCVGDADPAAMFPARAALVPLAASVLLFTLITTLAAVRPDLPAITVATGGTLDLRSIDVMVTPPPYSTRPAATLRNPSIIEGLAGSTIRIDVGSSAPAVDLETVDVRRTFERAGTGRFTIELPATSDGFIAVQARDAGGSGPRHLMGLQVEADVGPRVTFSEPARDLFLPDTGRTITVVLEAQDDIGLESLALRYTRVSGSGEQFTFTEGSLPLSIVREDARRWSARGTLRLADLGLAAGDMIVYRGIATDANPGGTPVESDSWIVEITAPGAIATGGFAIDDERDRYAISQQMVILKTEQLIARSAALPADSVRDQARLIAAEQRQVRAEFVFMMGGEVAEDIAGVIDPAVLDETAEAEAEGDILAGRLANRGRIEMVRAIRAMSAADAGLTAVELNDALRDERTALEHLQGAFSRTRYILRALTERERLDPTRRLTGDPAGATRDVRDPAIPVRDAATDTLRSVLARIAFVAAGEFGESSIPRLSRLAGQLLRVDPASGPLRSVATALSAAETDLRGGDTTRARQRLMDATKELAAAVRARLRAAPRQVRGLDIDRLEGALADALRASGSR